MSNESSFLILLEFEDGRTATQVVWPSMPIRHLCVQIGELARVRPDTVFCYFAGSMLDNERCISDPPAIGDGARVHVFFGIGRALRFVIHSLQGGQPPPTPPPTSPPQGPPTPYGPVIPPGFTRQPPATTPTAPGNATHPTSVSTSDRLRNTFKCPKFLGDPRHWKVWNQGFIRFLSINKLDYVIEDGFPSMTWTVVQQDDNKLVYYILEDFVSGALVAAKHIRRAAIWNEHEAYHFLYDGFALSGSASAAVLLGELSHFRFKTDETPTEVVLRLQELFNDLESIPGSAAMILNDTQKINYLLSAIRPERSLASVFAQIQSDQVRGKITFVEACDDLRYRCEAMRADDLLTASSQPAKVRGMVATPLPTLNPSPAPATSLALITTAGKRRNRDGVSKKEPTICLVKDCVTATIHNLRLCKRCYHECIAGKTPTLTLKTGDKATFDATTNRIIFPLSMEKGSKPAGPRSIIKAAVAFAPTADSD